MGLVLPTEGGDAGTYDTILNDAMAVVSDHNHTAGQGALVPTAGISINADLTFTTSGTAYAATDMKAAEFSPVAASAMTAYAGAFFVNSDDSNNLYFRTVAGSNVKVTSGATLNVGAFTGGFGGDYGSIPAEANFVDASKSYTFKSTASGNWSRLQAGAMRISEFGTTETTYVELACPSALAGTYTITMPTAAPGSTSIVSMSSAGVLTASNTITNAATFSGLVTASAGMTAAANQHVTVSGTGEFKHGDRTKNLSIHSGSGTMVYSVGAIRPVTGAGEVWAVDLGLAFQVGDRIKSIVYYFDPAGTGSISFQLFKRTLSSGGDSAVATASSTAGGSYQSVTSSSINYTLVSTEGCFLLFTSGQAADAFYAATITYDHP